MKQIFKTWKKATYFEGMFELRKNTNNAFPIEFPTVFTAYGAAIKSGNWQSCTSINTPNYVIDNFFDTVGYNVHDEMYHLWLYCIALSKITWDDVNNDKDRVLELIEFANEELQKLKII